MSAFPDRRPLNPWVLGVVLLILGLSLAATVGDRLPVPDEPGRPNLSELPLPRSTEFEISNVADSAMAEIRYAGGLTLDSTGLRMTFGPVPAFTSARVASDVVGWLQAHAIGVGLAERSDSGFRIVTEELQDVRDWGGLGVAGGWLAMLEEAELPGVAKEDLLGRWPVIIYEVRHAPDGSVIPRGTRIHGDLGYTRRIYVHGDPSIFERLLEPKPWEG